MGACVHHAVGSSIIVGQEFIVRIAVKRKLQHLHARIAGLRQKLPHLGRDIAQILRKNVQFSQLLLCRLEQLQTRPRHPGAVLSGFLLCRNGVIAFKAPEVVDANHVKQLAHIPQPVDPPGIARFSVLLPVIDRIAPKLPGGREAVRRTACHLGGTVQHIQLKQLRMCPDLHTVCGSVNGQIPDDGDSLLVGVCLELVPLLEELVLDEFIKGNILLVGFPCQVHRFLLPAAQGSPPLRKGLAVMGKLQRHVQGVILQPVLLRLHKGVKVRIRLCIGKGDPQHFIALGIQQRIGNGAAVLSPVQAVIIRRHQQAFLRQQIKVDQIRVSCIGTAGLIGGIPIARRRKGEHLPAGYLRTLQKIYKFICRPAHFPDAMPGRQTENREQNTASTHYDTSFQNKSANRNLFQRILGGYIAGRCAQRQQNR